MRVWLSFPLILVAVVALNGCSYEERTFAKIRKARKDNPQLALQLAKNLKESPKGLQLAFDDFDVYGGSNRGMSSWMLERSSLGPLIGPKLQAIALDTKQPLDRKIEAAFILWMRSNQENFAHLDQIFILIKDPSDSAVSFGRQKLCRSFVPEAEELRTALVVPGGKPVRITLERFQRLSR